MEASIKGKEITDFLRLLQCASRFGDDLNISANKDLWELAVTNSSKSAFCLFKLHKAFFCRYKATGTTVEQRRGVKCQLLVKSLLAVLGKTSASGNVERIDFKIHDPEHSLSSRRRRRRQRDESEANGHAAGDDEDEEEEDDVVTGIGAVLVMKLVCRHGVIKRHSLHLAASEFLRAEVDPDTTPSGFLISARTLRDWLDHFHIGLTSSHVTTSAGTTTIRQENQLSWMFSRDEVRVKSWEGGSRELSTEIKVDHAEFDEYEVFNGRVDLTLPMREFRAALALADQLSIRLMVAFSEPTQPLTLTSETYDDLEREPFEIFCAIATTTCDQFTSVRTASDPPANGTRSGSTPAASSSRGLSRERSTTALGDSNEGEGDGRNVRRRSNSERPATGSRARLSMSNRPTHISNSVPTTTTEQTKSRTTSNDPRANGGGQQREPLFLPAGSQNDPSHETDAQAEAGPSHSQQPRLSQAEVEAMSGLGDLDEMMEAMDDEQHQEELEEIRASQAVAAEPEPDDEESTRQPLADITSQANINTTLERDQTIFPDISGLDPPPVPHADPEAPLPLQAPAPAEPVIEPPAVQIDVPEEQHQAEVAQPEENLAPTPPPAEVQEPATKDMEPEVEFPPTQVDSAEARREPDFASRGFTKLFPD